MGVMFGRAENASMKKIDFGKGLGVTYNTGVGEWVIFVEREVCGWTLFW